MSTARTGVLSPGETRHGIATRHSFRVRSGLTAAARGIGTTCPSTRDLGDNSLVGSIPSAVALMPLVYLNLSENTITGSIPTELSLLELDELCVARTRLHHERCACMRVIITASCHAPFASKARGIDWLLHVAWVHPVARPGRSMETCSPAPSPPRWA